MKHFEKYQEHEGFAVAFWWDVPTGEVEQHFEPAWTGELIHEVTHTVLDVYQNFQEKVTDAMSALIDEISEQLTDVIRGFLK